MRVLLDTNVVLDVLLKRAPWMKEAEVIWQAGLDGKLQCFISASVITDIYYITSKILGKQGARQIVRDCLDAMTVVAVDKGMLEMAYASATPDFEDALQITCAATEQLDAIVTRDTTDFSHSTIAILSPTELVVKLGTMI